MINDPMDCNNSTAVMLHIEVSYKEPNYKIEEFIRELMEEYSELKMSDMEETIEWIIKKCDKKYKGESFVTTPHSTIQFTARPKGELLFDMSKIFN